MAPRIGSIDGAPGVHRARRRRRTDNAETTSAPSSAEDIHAAPGAAPITPTDPAPAVSAQMMGQSDSAETAAPAKSAAQARGAYLKVEWSGRYDRRTRSGRITKTDV